MHFSQKFCCTTETSAMHKPLRQSNFQIQKPSLQKISIAKKYIRDITKYAMHVPLVTGCKLEYAHVKRFTFIYLKLPCFLLIASSSCIRFSRYERMSGSLQHPESFFITDNLDVTITSQHCWHGGFMLVQILSTYNECSLRRTHLIRLTM